MGLRRVRAGPIVEYVSVCCVVMAVYFVMVYSKQCARMFVTHKSNKSH